MSDEKVLKRVITPNDQRLRDVFNREDAYFIDIYQREYKWTKQNVLTLLKDIELRFAQFNRTKKVPEEIRKDVLENYEPYFLNTYLTHYIADRVYLVDGQQRLTTFLLILIAHYNILLQIESGDIQLNNLAVKTFSSEAIKKFIYESNDWGEPERFKIFNENRQEIFNYLIHNKLSNSFQAKDETQKNILNNYKLIYNYYYDFYRNNDGIDASKITYYLTYLLDKLTIVEIKIEKQNDVAMIFEVVNDRGLGLKPYEILKGKLIGRLSGQEREKANEVWCNLQDKYFNTEIRNTTERTIDLDIFFRTFFRAKFANTEAEYDSFEGDYHYEIYRREDIRHYFFDFVGGTELYNRIINELKFFAELYHEIRTTYDIPFLIYNKLLDQNQQYLLILSNIKYNDQFKRKKIELIAKKFDQLHVVLRLLGAYDSSRFQRIIYQLNSQIRDKDTIEVEESFNKAIIKELEQQDIIQEGAISSINELFEFQRFSGISHSYLNFSKYILMRIDRYLADLLDKPSYVNCPLEELEERFNKTGRRKYGLHLEHIITRHEKYLDLFTENGVFDEQSFNRTRNLLGMLLLLKDRQNESSGNELYNEKIITYAQSNFVWNELLASFLPSVDIKNIPENLKKASVKPDEENLFPLNKVEQRQEALFDIIKMIWLF